MYHRLMKLILIRHIVSALLARLDQIVRTNVDFLETGMYVRPLGELGVVLKITRADTMDEQNRIIYDVMFDSSFEDFQSFQFSYRPGDYIRDILGSELNICDQSIAIGGVAVDYFYKHNAASELGIVINNLGQGFDVIFNNEWDAFSFMDDQGYYETEPNEDKAKDRKQFCDRLVNELQKHLYNWVEEAILIGGTNSEVNIAYYHAAVDYVLDVRVINDLNKTSLFIQLPGSDKSDVFFLPHQSLSRKQFIDDLSKRISSMTKISEYQKQVNLKNLNSNHLNTKFDGGQFKLTHQTRMLELKLNPEIFQLATDIYWVAKM